MHLDVHFIELFVFRFSSILHGNGNVKPIYRCAKRRIYRITDWTLLRREYYATRTSNSKRVGLR